MQTGGWQRGVGRLLLLVALTALIAGVGAELIVRVASPLWEPGLAIAVFGTFLTSMAIIAAFAIDGKSRWPTPWEVLDGASVTAWFLVALGSVVVALLAAAVDDAFLNALSLTLAFGGLMLGSLALWGLFSVSSERGRRKLVVDLLSSSIRGSGPPPRRGEADLGEIDTADHVPGWFLGADLLEAPRHGGVSIDLIPSVLRLYADRGDAEAIARLVDELHTAARQALEEDDWGEIDDYLGRADTLLGVQRGVFAELAERVLSGQLGEAIASGAMARAGEAAIDIAGRVRWPPASSDARDPRRAEALAARHLTALCRQAGAAGEEADVALRGAMASSGQAPADSGRARLVALSATSANLQQAARWAIDPEPPGMRIPPDHAWRRGLSGAEPSLVWLWGAAESPSGPYGVGLYALCQILSGRKFFGSYWDGEDVLSELDRRLAAPAHGPGIGAARAAIERAGGLPRLSLELAAARLSATTPRADAVASLREATGRDDRHVACNLFLAGGGYKPGDRDPVADLAWLLSDRLRGSLWTMVHGQLSQLPEPLVSPPLRPLHLRPEACALAVCLRLTPLAPEASPQDFVALREFAGALPPALLGATTALALRLTRPAEAEPPVEREATVNALVEAVRFVCRLVPAPAPALLAAARPSTSPRRKPDLPPLAPDAPEAFAAALPRLAGAEPGTEVDLIQCDARWLDRWSELRAALDAELLAAALRGDVRVRRIVPLVVFGEAGGRLTRLHYRWTDALITAAGCFAAGDDAPPVYRVRQLILPLDVNEEEPPGDCIVLRNGASDAGGAADFESVWGRFDQDASPGTGAGLIELGGRGAAPATGVAPVGP